MNHNRGPAGSPATVIAAEIARRIADGELRAGDRVPSTRQITQEFGVAMATATRALAALQERGLVRARAGYGTVVAARPERPERSAGIAAPEPPAGADPTTGSHFIGGTDSTTGSHFISGTASTTGSPPVTRGLTRQRITATAIRIADNDGLAALSMRRVAADLGTATMALYRHVRSKDELLLLMVEDTFAAYRLPDQPDVPRAALEALCHLQWRAYRTHPWLAQWVSMSRPQLVPSAMLHTEFAMAVLADLGLPANERLHMAVTLANYVRGTAINLEPEALAQQDTGLTSQEWMASQDQVMRRIVSSGDFPMFAALESDPTLDLTLESLFEFGLARLLDGLEALLRRRHDGDVR